MKKVLLLTLLMAKLTFAVDRYEIVYLLNEPVLFPKSDSSYIGDLLADKNSESMLELALFYSSKGEVEAAKLYLDQYKGENIAKKAEIYHNLGEYKKEVEVIEEFYNGLSEDEVRVYYNYILNLAREEQFTLEYRYKTFELYYLTTLITRGIEFKSYFDQVGWSIEEKEYISDLLFSINLRENRWLSDVFYIIANNNDKLKKAYADIYSAEDRDGYYLYFKLQEQLGIELGVRDSFEQLHKLKYYGEKEEYVTTYNQLLKELVEKRDSNALMSLYLISDDYKLAYNLALKSEDLHFQFLDKLRFEGRSQELVDRAVADFLKVYPDSKYKENIYLIRLSSASEDSDKLEILREYFESYYSDRLFRDYMKLVESLEGQEGLNVVLEYFIFDMGVEKTYLIREYDTLNREKENYIDKLKLLSDKSYYFNFARENNVSIERYFRDEYIQYLFELGSYDELEKYKKDLNYEQYKLLISKGYEQYRIEASEKYPFELKWVAEDSQKYFYLNKNYTYNQDIAEKLTSKNMRTAVEDYYLMSYYFQIGNEVEGEKLLKRLGRKYTF